MSSDEEFIKIKEGEATVLFSKKQAEAFYNPVQEFNRDISISVISDYLIKGNNKSNKKNKPYSPVIVEALAASGLRSIRYAKEFPQTINFKIIANDISPTAVEAIKKNIEYNNIKTIEPSQSDAVLLLYQLSQNKPDVIDLDPYGAPTIFLDAAFSSIKHGGLMAITCTDMACLAGTHIGACCAKYGSVPWHSSNGHEFGLRLALQSFAEVASRHHKYIKPILCFHIDFYLRVFIKVKSSVLKSSQIKLYESYVFTCSTCESFYLNKVCTNIENKIKPSQLEIPSTHCIYCKSSLRINGPIWNGNYFDKSYISELLLKYNNDINLHVNSRRRILGLLQLLSEELVDVPLFIALDRTAHFLKMSVPSLSIFKFVVLLLYLSNY